MLLFLQNWRSAIIPLIAVPVAIVGTFAVMAAHGLQPEQPDAVRPGAGDRHRRRRRHRRGRGGRASHRARAVAARRDASRRWRRSPGRSIAVGLVLSAVFVPCAFITGIIGQFFRQFALTIAVSTVISAFNSLTLSPALSALLLQAARQGRATQALPRLAFVLLGGMGWATWLSRTWRAAVAAVDLVPGVSIPSWALLGRRDRRRRDRRLGARPAAQLSAGQSVPRRSTSASTARPTSTRGSSACCCASACSCCWSTAGCSYLTYWSFTQTPDRLHPGAGQGLSAGQRAAARLGVGGADRSA